MTRRLKPCGGHYGFTPERQCFKEYGLHTDDSGNYAVMYKPYHLTGLELGISVAAVGLRKEATGAATGFRGDVVSVAKRDSNEDETLDGEGGYTVWGKLMPAVDSLKCAGLPIGLAQGIKITRRIAKGCVVTRNDIVTPDNDAVRVGREMEAVFVLK